MIPEASGWEKGRKGGSQRRKGRQREAQEDSRKEREKQEIGEKRGCMCAKLLPTLRPYELWPAGLLCPWASPGRNTGVGCHALLRGSSCPRDWTCVSCSSCIAGGSFITETPGKPKRRWGLRKRRGEKRGRGTSANSVLFNSVSNL